MPLGYYFDRVYFYTDHAMSEFEPLVFDEHDPEMTEKVCAFARERRRSMKVSQNTITEITNIRQGHISDIERFNRPSVSFNHLAWLLIELNCRITIEPLN